MTAVAGGKRRFARSEECANSDRVTFDDVGEI
jgi:hypothetical protein